MRRPWGLLGVAIALFSACSSDETPSRRPRGDAGCSDGTEGCACYGNDTCNRGLVCAAGKCTARRTSLVDAALGDAPSPGTAGRSGTSGATSVSAGGASGIADAGPDATSGKGGVVGSGGRQSPGGMTSEGGPVTDTGAGGKTTVPKYSPFAMFIMLDRSTSMTQMMPGATSTSWDNAVAALTAFVHDPDSAGIDIGLGTFPVGAQNTFDCTAGMDCGTPVVPIAALPGNGASMLAAMTTQTPTQLGFTPTECGLRGMVNECLTYMAASPSGEPCIGVLVTDGAPTQCNLDEAALTAIIAEGKSKGVTTFALGLAGADVTVLNQYATAGGSTAAIDVSGGPASFTAALKKIRESQTRTVMPVGK